MAKVSIIDVDLSLEINGIISDEVIAITQQNLTDVETALEPVRAARVARQQKIDSLSAKTNLKTDRLTIIRAKMIEVGNKGITQSDLEALGGDSYASISALVLGLKTFLRKTHHSEYVLLKKRSAGNTIYYLRPFNFSPQDSVAS